MLTEREVGSPSVPDPAYCAVAVYHAITAVGKRLIHGEARDAVASAGLLGAPTRGIHGDEAWTAVECQWSDDRHRLERMRIGTRHGDRSGAGRRRGPRERLRSAWCATNMLADNGRSDLV